MPALGVARSEGPCAGARAARTRVWALVFAVFPGKVTLKKGLAKGTYKVKVAVTSKFKVSVAKTVTVTIKVK